MLFPYFLQDCFRSTFPFFVASAVVEMVSPPYSFSQAAPTVFPMSEGNPVAVAGNVAFSTFPLSTRAEDSVSARSGKKCSRDDDRSSLAIRFCSGEELLRTRMKMSPIRGLPTPPMHGTARGGYQSNTATTFPLAAFTISSSGMLVSVYIVRQ